MIRHFLNLSRCRKEQKTPSDKDYILSVLSAARIGVSDIGLGRTSLISLFVYKTKDHLIEESNIIKKEFGENVALIIDGLAKVGSIEEKTISSQAENFRRLLLNLAKDVRVILIILAERLEYMRELKNAPTKSNFELLLKQHTLYAPLAHRLVCI